MFARYRHQFAVLGYVGAAALFSNTVAAQSANNTASEPPGEVIDEVIVSGFRASLQNSVEAKRGNIAFTDSIYAEDIGKFPDLNLAESLQRIPGVQIARDFTGEGTSVAVRGLGKDFTQITLNGSPVETASDSNIDSVSQGRGIDLVLFPTELFSKLTVSKTPVASQTEGAVAANIDLRIARPFDEKGFHVNYSAKGSFQESSEEWSPRLGFYASNTWDTGLGEFGILGGVAYSDRSYRSDGFNTIGFTTVGLGPRCPFTQAGCNTQANPNTAQGYGNSSQAWPTTVPAGYSFGANGATAGDPLTVCGPGSTPGGTSGLSCNDLSYSVWPRLARPDSLVGERETTSGILAMQWAPSENLSFFFDSLYSEADHVYERNDLNLAVRSTNTNVPVNVELDDNNVVRRATLANPQWLNENRPYDEDTDFINLNSGMEWKIGEKFTVDASATYNHSDFFRSTNTYLFNSVLNSGITVDIEANGDGVIKVTPSQDLNNTNFWTDRLFGVWVTAALDDPATSRPYLLQGGLDLPDREYYLEDSPRMASVRKEFAAHVARTLRLAGVADADAGAAAIVALETRMARVHASRAESIDVLKANNRWKREEFPRRAPGGSARATR